MPKATHTPTTSRRRVLLGSVPAAVLAGCIPTPAPAAEGGADTELIRLCREFDALERQIDALFAMPYPPPPADWHSYEQARGNQHGVLRDQQESILDRICILPCRTAEGRCALAESYALLMDGELEDVPHDGPEDRILRALARGVLGRA